MYLHLFREPSETTTLASTSKLTMSRSIKKQPRGVCHRRAREFFVDYFTVFARWLLAGTYESRHLVLTHEGDGEPSFKSSLPRARKLVLMMRAGSVSKPLELLSPDRDCSRRPRQSMMHAMFRTTLVPCRVLKLGRFSKLVGNAGSDSDLRSNRGSSLLCSSWFLSSVEDGKRCIAS